MPGNGVIIFVSPDISDFVPMSLPMLHYLGLFRKERQIAQICHNVFFLRTNVPNSDMFINLSNSFIDVTVSHSSYSIRLEEYLYLPKSTLTKQYLLIHNYISL